MARSEHNNTCLVGRVDMKIPSCDHRSSVRTCRRSIRPEHACRFYSLTRAYKHDTRLGSSMTVAFSHAPLCMPRWWRCTMPTTNATLDAPALLRSAEQTVRLAVSPDVFDRTW
ncbi:hypothetical protein DOTSEDRAFT_71125 [Dothistroma septosporum NZE10]|uniref:Uncharacterized protein n=1 Tax=Dothistroma septosporum (strain NZE10 / CBS 128990) TaxID=675120 RepID=N1PSA8_DOTSN|nr:hypothetical protein DOTSEDRAFT_71125 [Dothistroma septosporum NZE10]